MHVCWLKGMLSIGTEKKKKKKNLKKNQDFRSTPAIWIRDEFSVISGS